MADQCTAEYGVKNIDESNIMECVRQAGISI